MDRFVRQINLREMGVEGQQRLANASVLVVGAGGLGCPALIFLAAAGVGKISILDGDRVSVSNLNRQVLYGREDVGKLKAEVAAQQLSEKYGDSDYQSLPFFLTPENAAEVIGDCDLVLDCTDNFPTRYLINDACVLLGKPFVQGAIFEDEGQLGVFNLPHKDRPACNYRDLYPEPPAGDLIPDCNETGVLGVLPGVIGTLQASEAIKVICKRGEPLAGKIFFLNLYNNESYTLEVSPRSDSSRRIPSDMEELRSRDYGIACRTEAEVSWLTAKKWLESDNGHSVLVDVRNPGERPLVNLPGTLSLPLIDIEKQGGRLEKYDRILFFCKIGQRSLTAVEKMRDLLPDSELYSVEGGVLHPDSPVKATDKWVKN